MREPVQTQTEDLADSHWANSVLPATGTLVIPQSPAFLNIKCSYLEALQALGYTESEARSLYIVATHSGYFGARFCVAQRTGYLGNELGPKWFVGPIRSINPAHRSRFPP